MRPVDARTRSFAWILTLGICFVSGGATCARREVALTLPPPPPVLEASPGLEQVVAAVNRTASIRELSTNTATVDVLSMPGLPNLSATINLRKDRDFRLKANLPLVLGSGLDMGSNNSVFWFEVPEGMSRTLYYARHDQYSQQLNRAILPVDPNWITDALGLVQIDPANVVRGPVLRPDGKLEIRSVLPLPSGTYQRVCYIDAAGGHVTDQLLYSPTGALIAESHASNHQFYVEQNCALPHSVKFALNPINGQPLEMRIDVGIYSVNQILSGDPNLFVMPQSASNAVDLTTLSAGGTQAVAPASYQAPANYQPNTIGPMPYRGLVR
ncbi:MAG: hypothetical protein KDB00_01645 [Planctomycetales bacterium]|nr:hypothetical protein [Planctomycetales bacterium]